MKKSCKKTKNYTTLKVDATFEQLFDVLVGKDKTKKKIKKTDKKLK